jgi:NTE family protein
MPSERLGRQATGWLTRLLRHPPQPTEGLVLSGGRSGAYFQLGALRYLYDKVGITPSVITGTSAGSMLAALLAQADDHAGQRRVLADIERVSQGVRQNSDMFTELAWYAELQKLMPAWQKALTAQPRNHDSRTITLPSLGLRSRHKDAEAEAAGRTTISLPRWDRSPVLDTLSMIWTMRRSGTDIDILLRGAPRERSMFRPGPIFDALLNPGVFDPTRLAESRAQLRIAVVGSPESSGTSPEPAAWWTGRTVRSGPMLRCRSWTRFTRHARFPESSRRCDWAMSTMSTAERERTLRCRSR